MLFRLAHMRQASFFHCVFLDASPPLDDGLATPELDVGWCQVAEALVVSVVVIVVDKSFDLSRQIFR